MEQNNVIVLEGLDRFSDDDFFNFCVQNRNHRIERQADGTVIIMSPAGYRSSKLSLKVARTLDIWAESTKMGSAAESSGGFILKDGSMRSPDASWISDERLEGISEEAQEKFLVACPNFVVEVLSPSDSLKTLQRKMDLWLQNGVEVGWLINPETEEVTIYEAGKSPVVVKGFDQSIDCPHLLPGFVLDLRLLRLK